MPRVIHDPRATFARLKVCLVCLQISHVLVQRRDAQSFAAVVNPLLVSTRNVTEADVKVGYLLYLLRRQNNVLRRRRSRSR